MGKGRPVSDITESHCMTNEHHSDWERNVYFNSKQAIFQQQRRAIIAAKHKAQP